MKKLSFVLTLLFLGLFCFSYAQAGEVRTWTAGNHSVDGEFIELIENGTIVSIRKTDGKFVRVSLAKLSQEDQEYINSKTKEPLQATPASSFEIEGTVLKKFIGSETDVVIPEGVTVIGDWAFWDCSSLTSVVIPEGVTEIGGWAFERCSSLTSVALPEGVTEIGSSAFAYCTSLTSVVIPEGVTVIGFCAFERCSSLTSVVIPEGVTEIGKLAFSGCSSLTSVVIPDSVQEIGVGAFADCTALKEWLISSDHPLFKTDGTGLLTKDGKKLVACLGSATEYWIPEGVTEIGKGAFFGCSSLTSVVIPDSVQEIRGGAFAGCSSLTSVVIPEGVKEISGTAFARCTAMEEWSISSDHPYFKTDGTGLLTKDGKKLVACLPSAREYRIPEGVTEIGGGAFMDCHSLTSVEIPASVTEIGGGAFMECHSLTSVVIPEGVTKIGDSAFEGCPELTIYAPAGSYAEEYANDNWIPFEEN